MILNSTVDIPGWINQMETLIEEKQIKLSEGEAQHIAAEAQKEQECL